MEGSRPSKGFRERGRFGRRLRTTAVVEKRSRARPTQRVAATHFPTRNQRRVLTLGEIYECSSRSSPGY